MLAKSYDGHGNNLLQNSVATIVCVEPLGGKELTRRAVEVW